MAKANGKRALDGLTLKQRIFCQEWVKNGGNGARAAQVAYDTTYDGARSIAAHNLNRPKVGDFIKSQLQAKDLTVEYILNELIKKSASENEPISLKAIELIGKHLKMFTEKIDHTHSLEQVTKIGWDD